VRRASGRAGIRRAGCWRPAADPWRHPAARPGASRCFTSNSLRAPANRTRSPNFDSFAGVAKIDGT